MTDAAKWKEFLRWWRIYKFGAPERTKEEIVLAVNNKIDRILKLQKGEKEKCTSQQ